MQITLTFPLPHKSLRPNSFVKWNVRFGLTKQARERAKRAMFEAAKRIDAEVWIIKGYRLNYWFKTKRLWDADNCTGFAVKATLDGIADAANQDDKTFEYLGLTRTTDTKNPRLEIILLIDELI